MTDRLSPAATALCKGADAGLFTLPDELARLRSARTHLGDQLNRPAPNPGAAQRTYEAAVLGAAMSGTDLPEPVDVVAEQSALEVYNTRQRAVRQTHDQLTREMSIAIDDLAEAVIVETLRPPWTLAYGHARKAVEAFLPYGTTKAELFSAPTAARKAFVEFAAHVETMAALNEVVDRLRLSGGNRPELDEFDLCRFVRDVRAAWPEVVDNRSPIAGLHKIKPWPADPAERLVWSVRTGHALWFPSPHEQDVAWRGLFAERLADHAQQTMRHSTARAWSSS